MIPRERIVARTATIGDAIELRDRRMIVADNPPTEIQTLIDNHINAFNTQDNELFFRVFGDTAIIVDGIAPYRWLNPNAPANWLADVAKWREDLGVSYEHLSYEMGVLERGRIGCIRRHSRDAHGDHQG
jgi:hypothetical protein